LKTKNKIEYFNIIHDIINFSQNSTYAIISANTKNNILNAIQTTKKFFVNIDLTNLIFSCSHLLCISENKGKSNQKIGQIIINGIDIILR
jgi:hypothetical protein